MTFKDFVINKIGYVDYYHKFPKDYTETEIVNMAQEWHSLEIKGQRPSLRIIQPTVRPNCRSGKCGIPKRT